jgi:hypothetical protein
MDPFNQNPRSKIKLDQHESLLKELNELANAHPKGGVLQYAGEKLKAKYASLKHKLVSSDQSLLQPHASEAVKLIKK